ncbi:General stress protein 18 [compost metagenome]
MWYPVLRLRESGAQVDIAATGAGKVLHGKYGVPITSDVSFDDVSSADYDGLYVPGGWAPDKLRRYPQVLRLTREFHEAGKPIAQICHAGWVRLWMRWQVPQKHDEASGPMASSRACDGSHLLFFFPHR